MQSQIGWHVVWYYGRTHGFKSREHMRAIECYSCLYNVVYDAPDGLRVYCLENMPYQEALWQVESFKTRYLNPDGTGKLHPNGKDYYPFRNPRIVRVQ